jgi:hypothetical protein
MKKNVLYLFAWLILLGCNSKPELTPTGNLNLFVYPNPTSGWAEVILRNTSSRSYTLLVFNPEGQQILQRTVDPGEQRYSLPLLDQPKGNYQVIVDTPNGVIRKKFVKL